jgi:hypothetical protein
MVDVCAVVRTYLAGLGAFSGVRLYAERDEPPVNYNPSQGPALVFKVRGGNLNYPSVFVMASMQFKCYGITNVVANDVYLSLINALHDARTNTILSAEVEVLGQILEEPQTLWTFVLCFFSLILVR